MKTEESSQNVNIYRNFDKTYFDLLPNKAFE